MTAHRFSLVDVILADDLRQESTGKLLVIGMYLGSIIAARIPIMLPTLAVITKWRSPDGSLPAGVYRILSPADKVVHQTEAKAVEAGPPAPFLLAVNKFTPVMLESTGVYRWTFTPKGGRPRTLASFTVATLTPASEWAAAGHTAPPK